MPGRWTFAFHGTKAVLESLPPFDQHQGMTLIDEERQPLDAYLRSLALFVAAGEREDMARVPYPMFEAMQEDVVVIAQTGVTAVIDSPLPEGRAFGFGGPRLQSARVTRSRLSAPDAGSGR